MMPIKLTSKEYRIIAIVLIVSALSLVISLKYFWRAFPEASIDFRVNRGDSEELAEKFLAEYGFSLETHHHAVIFNYDDRAKLYLERTQGLPRMNQLTQAVTGPIHIWRWSHRWFKPLEKEEFRVDVSPAGGIVGFRHELPEAAPGADLPPEGARRIAEEFLARKSGAFPDLTELELLEASQEKRPARTDHTLTWVQKSVQLGDGSQRIDVVVSGDRVSAYREYIHIPEQWLRQYEELRSRNNAVQSVDEVLWILLTVAMAVILIRRLRDRDVQLKLSLGFGSVAAILVFLDRLNTFSLAQFGYSTSDTYLGFMGSYFLQSVLGALGMGIVIFLVVAASEPIYRETLPQLPSLGRILTWQGLRTRSFFMANVVGIGMTFFFFAYQTVFYLFANKLGAWAPSDVPFSDELNTAIPWVAVLFGGFAPAVLEEMQFRTFAIPFLHRALRLWPAAIVLAAFNWGFLHAAYPNEPFFIRGVEVGLGGVVVGLIMLRFGVIATMIWHYSVDAIYTAFILLRSTNRYLMVSGAITGGIMLVPFLIALMSYLRTRTFSDESPLTNAAVGTRRIPDAAVTAEPVASESVYEPLDSRRIALGGILIVVFVILSLLPAHQLGEDIRIAVTRSGAIQASTNFLAQRNVPAESYRSVAWLHENIDASAVKYLFEHLRVQEADRLYRQATHLLLWQVRYFRPLEKEEYRVFVDATTGEIFGYQHLLDENTPGSSLTPEQAQVLAADSMREHGYALADFELVDSQAEKRKAREDYKFTWQAKPGDPRNVADARYRIQVDVAGDQIVGFSRLFKLPETWRRQRESTGLVNTVLTAVLLVFFAGVGTGLVGIFIQRVRSGRIAWAASGRVAIFIAVFIGISALTQLTTVDRGYDTSIPLATFRLFTGIGLFVTPLLAGLLAWLLVGVATSVYPQAWSIFKPAARASWSRDAAIAILISIAGIVAASQMTALLTNLLHATAQPNVDLVPNVFDSYAPGLNVFLMGVVYSIGIVAAAGLLIYVLRAGWGHRAWWFWPGSTLLLIVLGPANAHSPAEFLTGWVIRAVPLSIAAWVLVLFMRNNLSAYFGAGFLLAAFNPGISLLIQHSAFYRWNGLLVVILAALAFAWLLAARRGRYRVSSV
jgi:membrane protease YdiL (CAAX protease family)